MITGDQLEALVGEVKPALKRGSVSTYLPELAVVSADRFGAAVKLGSGQLLSVGDSSVTFTMQSVVKVFALLVAVHDRGRDYVFERVGCDSTDAVFNSFETFRRGSGIPANPFVNSGALTVVDMVEGGDAEAKVRRVLEIVRKLSGNPAVGVNREVALSEFTRSDRNRALSYFLRSNGQITSDVEDLLWAYCQLCAIEVSATDLAQIGSVMAHDAEIEATGLLSGADIRVIRRLMLMTGMYSDSGRYACNVGIPAKCGISGAMLGVVPGLGGIGVFGPSLDEISNSVGGVRLMELLSEVLDVR